MKTLVEGHKYLLAHHQSHGCETIQFIHKEQATDGSGEFRTVAEGTTNEEVLTMLIDRLNYLQKKASCRENAIVITKLEESLMWLNKRTSDRQARGVEGTSAK